MSFVEVEAPAECSTHSAVVVVEVERRSRAFHAGEPRTCLVLVVAVAGCWARRKEEGEWG
jgi:hypothetical protein